MESAPIVSSLHSPSPRIFLRHPHPGFHGSNGIFSSTKKPSAVALRRNCCSDSRAVATASDISAAITSLPAHADVTWEIVVGALAGVAPFVVAGIEFRKRIVAQRECEVCKGSGLVLRDNKYYFRCPACGGFLPWQSWKRFFTG